MLTTLVTLWSEQGWFGPVRASQIKVTGRSTSGQIQVMVGTQSLNLVIWKSISGQFGVTRKSHWSQQEVNWKSIPKCS